MNAEPIERRPLIPGPVVLLRDELCALLAAYGALVGFLAFIALSLVEGKAFPNELWGVRFHLALGVPLAILSVLHFLCAGLLIAYKSRIFCIAGALATTAFAVFYFAFTCSFFQCFLLNWITLVVVGMSALLWTRTRKYLSLVAEEAAKGPQKSA